MEDLKHQTLQDQLVKVRADKMEAVKSQNWEIACNYRERELELLEELGTPVHGEGSNLRAEKQKNADQWNALQQEINEGGR